MTCSSVFQTLLLLAEDSELRSTIAAHIGMLDQLETVLHRSVTVSFASIMSVTLSGLSHCQYQLCHAVNVTSVRLVTVLTLSCMGN